MTDKTITNGAMPITLAFDDMGVQVVSAYEGHTDMIPVMWSAVPDLIAALAQGLGRQCYDAHKACDGFGLQLDKIDAIVKKHTPSPTHGRFNCAGEYRLPPVSAGILDEIRAVFESDHA